VQTTGKAQVRVLPELPDKAHQEFYNLFRQQVVSEDNLVNYRMTWLLLLQAFLLAILGGALSQSFQQHVKDIELFKWLICVIGISGSLLIGIGVWAAQRAINCLVREYEKPYGGADNIPKHLPPIVGGETPHVLGAVPLFLPILCFAVWIVVGCVVH
jgi:hypothetical protein